MDYIKRKESISIVVLCNTLPVFIHIRWMSERGIITGQEFADSVDKGFQLNENQSIFQVGSDINVYCDRSRFQIESFDITASQRITDICKGTLSLNQPSAFAAVGINAYMDFTFYTEEDAFRFGNTFVPLDKWDDIIPNPRVGNFTIQEDIATPTITHPRRALNIQCLGADNKTKLALVRISANNHHPISNILEMEKVLAKTQDYYNQFYEWLDKLFKEKLA